MLKLPAVNRTQASTDRVEAPDGSPVPAGLIMVMLPFGHTIVYALLLRKARTTEADTRLVGCASVVAGRVTGRSAARLIEAVVERRRVGEGLLVR